MTVIVEEGLILEMLEANISGGEAILLEDLIEER